MFETVTLDMRQIWIKSKWSFEQVKWSLDRMLTYTKGNKLLHRNHAVIPPRAKN